MLQQAPVAGLAVARVKTVLEHGGLYVVTPSLLFRRQALNLLAQLVGLNVLVLKVAPAGLVRPRYSPSLALALIGYGFDRFVCVSCLLVYNRQTVFVVPDEFPAVFSLHLARLEPHACMTIGKSTVLRTLVGSVCVQFLNGGICNPLAVPGSLLEEMAVCKDCRLDLYGGDDDGLVILHCLGDVCHISLYLLVILVAIGGIGVVGVLYAVCLNCRLVAKHGLAVFTVYCSSNTRRSRAQRGSLSSYPDKS